MEELFTLPNKCSPKKWKFDGSSNMFHIPKKLCVASSMLPFLIIPEKLTNFPTCNGATDLKVNLTLTACTNDL